MWWDEAFWQAAESGEIANFRPESTRHRPRAAFRLVHDSRYISGIFRVEDRYVRAVVKEHNGPVCTDSCVEFFVRPRQDKGYFNFEFSANGTLHASYIEDWRRTAAGFAKRTFIDADLAAAVERCSTLPSYVEPEISEPMVWQIGFRLPVSLLERFIGPLGEIAGQRWRANFYKCGDRTSHPHWAAWAPVSSLNFHLPECFGEICIAPNL